MSRDVYYLVELMEYGSAVPYDVCEQKSLQAYRNRFDN